ncbi:MAG: HEAT repeat domain-containing protein [Planctomycetota bacterium]|jgi:HEAT repeat protein|nr:HEAT repeat domain-containing protein [Planctomycetota bacterium]
MPILPRPFLIPILACAPLVLSGAGVFPEVVPAVESASSADDEIIAEFKKYYRKYKDVDQKIEAILALEGVEALEVVDVLLPLLSAQEGEIVEAASRVLGQFKTRGPIDHVFAKLAKERKSERRAGILDAVMRGGYVDLGEALLDCLEDRDWNVRRLALRAVAAGGKAENAALCLPLCSDKEIAVRCAALDGLSLMGSDLVRPPAMKALQDPAWQVRACAIHALGNVRHKDSMQPLIEALEREEGRLRADAAAALESLTARGFGQRLELWQRFWSNYKDRYEIPTDAELAALRAKQAEHAEIYKPSDSVAFHGVDTPSRRVLFIIDVSGSMENEVVDKDRFVDGEYPSYSRIDIVKTELARTVEGLEPYVEFNILAFATEVKKWKKGLTRANVLNKSSAMDFARRLEPLGGASKQELAEVGLVGAAGLGAGKTNTYGALAAGLGLDAKKPKGYHTKLDTIFFLSDGKPTTGQFTERNEILREIKRANDLRRIVIHTIALGQFDKEFMRLLAQENGGVFVDLGE